MRISSTLAVMVAAMAVSACTVVERPAPPTVVQTPAVVAPAQTVPPSVTVRPGY